MLSMTLETLLWSPYVLQPLAVLSILPELSFDEGGTFDTGIKVVDLLFSGAGVDKTYLSMELINNVAQTRLKKITSFSLK